MNLGMPTLIETRNIRDCVLLCRELGLNFVELNMNLPQYQVKNIDVAMFRYLAESQGIFYTIHLDENLNVSDYNPHVSAAWMKTVLETIQLAKALNVTVLNMHLSRGVYFTLPEGKIFLFDQYRERYLKSMEEFRALSEMAIGDGDIKICVENTDGFTEGQIAALDLLLESPVFGLTFDVGHDQAKGGWDEPVIMERVEKLCHMHLHDAAAGKNHLPLGSGEVNAEKYLRLARENDCCVVLETKTIAGLRESVAWVRNHYDD